jgi:hypothetical protein
MVLQDGRVDMNVLAILVGTLDGAGGRDRLVKRLESKLSWDIAKLLESPDKRACRRPKEYENLTKWADLPDYLPNRTAGWAQLMASPAVHHLDKPIHNRGLRSWRLTRVVRIS